MIYVIVWCFSWKNLVTWNYKEARRRFLCFVLQTTKKEVKLKTYRINIDEKTENWTQLSNNPIYVNLPHFVWKKVVTKSKNLMLHSHLGHFSVSCEWVKLWVESQQTEKLIRTNFTFIYATLLYAISVLGMFKLSKNEKSLPVMCVQNQVVSCKSLFKKTKIHYRAWWWFRWFRYVYHYGWRLGFWMWILSDLWRYLVVSSPGSWKWAD